jgi:U3 small nucleolar RNA-associated protein 21
MFRANRAQYADVSFHTVREDDITDVSVPSMQGTAEDEGWSMCQSLSVHLADTISRSAALEALSALKVQDEPVDVFSTPPQLDGDLITLTLLPRSRWQTLLNLEVIQVRITPSFS